MESKNTKVCRRGFLGAAGAATLAGSLVASGADQPIQGFEKTPTSRR